MMRIWCVTRKEGVETVHVSTWNNTGKKRSFVSIGLLYVDIEFTDCRNKCSRVELKFFRKDLHSWKRIWIYFIDGSGKIIRNIEGLLWSCDYFKSPWCLRFTKKSKTSWKLRTFCALFRQFNLIAALGYESVYILHLPSILW